jgi:hypothetical protein
MAENEGQNPNQNQNSSGIGGWLVFILIFGVGNLILYKTTGMVLIPIPRK